VGFERGRPAGQFKLCGLGRDGVLRPWRDGRKGEQELLAQSSPTQVLLAGFARRVARHLDRSRPKNWRRKMSVHQLNSSKPILCFKVTGTLTRAEVGQLQATTASSIMNWGKVSALVILEDFRGWQKGPGWDDLSFANEHDRNIEKMAIVGPEQWRDLACVFAGKGLRSVEVDYFLPSQLEQARKWLSNL
jgi:hypothetical protein